MSTPQSRLAPCQLPGRGAFWGGTTNQKLSSLAGKVARSAERGAAKNSRMPRVIPPQLRLRSAAPPQAVAPLGVQYKLGVQCRTPSRSDRFNGVTGGAGGPKGRNRNLPWPPCKKVIKKLAVLFCLFHSLSLTSFARPPSQASATP